MLCSTEVPKCKLDLGLVVDRAKSIRAKSIPKLKAALKNLIQRFEISRDETHISFETFATESKLHNAFNDTSYHSEVAILGLINLSINKLRSPTRLDRAVKLAKEVMFTNKNGVRFGVRKAMVLCHDGRTHPSGEQDFYQDIRALKVSPQPFYKCVCMRICMLCLLCLLCFARSLVTKTCETI